MGGHGADNAGDDDHPQESDRIAVHSEIKLHKGISEYVIDADYSDKGGDYPRGIAIGIPGDKYDGQDIDDCHAGGIFSQIKEKDGQ